jgi:hypothetical protein
MQRLLHEPTIRLKESGHGRQQVLRELFGLDEGVPEAQAPPAETASETQASDNVRPLKRRA